MLYCIKHGTMESVAPFQTPWHMTATWEDEGFADVGMCDFDLGWATCPPPDFDMDAWVESLGYEYEMEPEEETPASLEDMDFYNEFLVPRLRSQDG